MVPDRPKIYHLTHLNNLARIISEGRLISDRLRVDSMVACELVGISGIKEWRLDHAAVSCHAGTHVGDFVPFYFCPRSIMLFMIHTRHAALAYKGGQGPIVHLQADLQATVRWADENGIRWAFTDRNAAARLAEFFCDMNDLDKVNWAAVASTDFRDAQVKDGKQAEFLLYESFPWTLVEKIGVLDGATAGQVIARLMQSKHQPTVEQKRPWYY